jgi:hypothetical protein
LYTAVSREKCILTGSAEQRYFKVDGSTEKKWDTVIPADLKILCKWDVYVPLVTKGLILAKIVYINCNFQWSPQTIIADSNLEFYGVKIL